MRTKRTPWVGEVTPIRVNRDLSPEYLLICLAARARVSNEHVVLRYAYDEDVFVTSATIVLPLMYGRGRNRNNVKIEPRGATTTELFADLDRDLVKNGIEPCAIEGLCDDPEDGLTGDPPKLSEKERIVMDLLVSRGLLYGMEIVEASAGALHPGTIYVTLSRMETKGYVASFSADAPVGHRGPPRRKYRLTIAGERALRAHARAVEIWKGA